MNPKSEARVMHWIKTTVVSEEFTVEDFPWFPAGKLLTDKEGGRMVVYLDIINDRVETRLPDQK